MKATFSPDLCSGGVICQRTEPKVQRVNRVLTSFPSARGTGAQLPQPEQTDTLHVPEAGLVVSVCCFLLTANVYQVTTVHMQSFYTFCLVWAGATGWKTMVTVSDAVTVQLQEKQPPRLTGRCNITTAININRSLQYYKTQVLNSGAPDDGITSDSQRCFPSRVGNLWGPHNSIGSNWLRGQRLLDNYRLIFF